MKQILLLCSSFIFFNSCNKENVSVECNSIQIIAIVDITDPHLLLPQPDAILALYYYDEDENTEAFFRLQTLSDKLLTPNIEFHLEDGLTTERKNKRDDPHFREQYVLSFYDSVRTTLNKFNNEYDTSISLNNSECYRTIIQEINNLKECKAKEKVLLIFSDLMENSDLFNIYSENDLKQLLNNPEKIAEKLIKAYPPPDDLSDIKIYFVFQPRTRDEDIAYRLIVSVYEIILKQRGAKVIIQAQNKNYM